MLVKEEISLTDFDAWSGGRDTLDKLVANGNVDVIEDEINELYPDGIDKTQLNDYLWFDCEDQHPELFEDEDSEEEDDEDDEEESDDEDGDIE